MWASSSIANVSIVDFWELHMRGGREIKGQAPLLTQRMVAFCQLRWGGNLSTKGVLFAFFIILHIPSAVSRKKL